MILLFTWATKLITEALKAHRHAQWDNISPQGPFNHLVPEAGTTHRKQNLCNFDSEKKRGREREREIELRWTIQVRFYVKSPFTRTCLIRFCSSPSSSSSSSSLVRVSRHQHLNERDSVGSSKVNSEIEANIKVTREIESEIVKCSEIESNLSAKESELTKSFLASQFEIRGLISVTSYYFIPKFTS